MAAAHNLMNREFTQTSAHTNAHYVVRNSSPSATLMPKMGLRRLPHCFVPWGYNIRFVFATILPVSVSVTLRNGSSRTVDAS